MKCVVEACAERAGKYGLCKRHKRTAESHQRAEPVTVQSELDERLARWRAQMAKATSERRDAVAAWKEKVKRERPDS